LYPYIGLLIEFVEKTTICFIGELFDVAFGEISFAVFSGKKKKNRLGQRARKNLYGNDTAKVSGTQTTASRKCS